MKKYGKKSQSNEFFNTNDTNVGYMLLKTEGRARQREGERITQMEILKEKNISFEHLVRYVFTCRDRHCLGRNTQLH